MKLDKQTQDVIYQLMQKEDASEELVIQRCINYYAYLQGEVEKGNLVHVTNRQTGGRTQVLFPDQVITVNTSKVLIGDELLVGQEYQRTRRYERQEDLEPGLRGYEDTEPGLR